MICAPARGCKEADMNLEYNKLTTGLLAQGFTADNHPDYVKLPGCIPDKNNPLRNYDGGFVYQGSYADSLTYKTGCGKFVKGKNVLHDMGYMGIDWCHENDNPVMRCPYGNPECSRNNPLLHGTHGGVLRAQCWCECHKTAEPYDYRNSIELANAEREAERRQKYEEYVSMHHGRVCANHMYYDEHTRTWSQRYEPHQCFHRCCSHFCPIQNRELSKKRGNVYYDLKTTRIRQDGTLFDGEKIVSVTRGIRYYDHPVSMDICEAFVKLQGGRIYEEYKWNHSQLWALDRTFQAEILNIRAESRPSRDLMQDLQDIKNGIEIRYDADLRKADKEQKSRKRAEAMEKKIQALERKLLDVGYENLETYSLDKIHADKWLTPERIRELAEIREQRMLEEKNQPVQLSLPLDVLFP